MKKKLLKTLLPIASIGSIVALAIPSMVSCGGKKEIEIVTANDEILPMSMLQKEDLELKAIDKKSGEEITDAVFSTESNLISIDGNTITAITPGEATIKCEVEGQEPKEFILDVADQTYHYNLAEPFTPTIETLKGELKLSQATDTYLEAVLDNPKIIAEDVAYTWETMDYETSGWESLDVTPVYITADQSFVNIKIHAEGKVPQGSGDYNETIQDIEYRNIPVMINYGEFPKIGPAWGMSSLVDPAGEYLLSHDNWLFYQKDVYDNGQSIVHYWDYNKLKEDPSQAADIGLIWLAFNFSLPGLSHYLKDATPSK